MCKTKKITRIDTVGSFLRPERLKKARTAYNDNRISKQELVEIENEEIKKIVEKQKEIGLEIVTDGEFRQRYWHLDFFWGFEGVDHHIIENGVIFNIKDSARLSGKIRFKHDHPYLESFKYLKAIAGDDVVARQSIPAPAQLYKELTRSDKAYIKNYYADENELLNDLSKAYHDFILAIYNLGCRDLKLDDCTWGMLCDTNNQKNTVEEKNKLQHIFLQVNNEAIKNLPDDLIISTHVCRGNCKSNWGASGGYEPVAENLFSKENVEKYYLEFDNERSGGFEPLRFISDNKQVVLGLITSKNPTLEDKAHIISRIKEASQFISLDRLSLSPQCGFASTEEGNILTEEDQWKKIKLIKEIASEVWVD